MTAYGSGVYGSGIYSPATDGGAHLDNLGLPIDLGAHLDSLGIQPDPCIAPGPVTHLKVTAGDGTVTISWIPPDDHGSGITHYLITATTPIITGFGHSSWGEGPFGRGGF